MIIYVLELENNKYYIGKTNNLEKRLNDHREERGCEWTKRYKYLKLKELRYNIDNNSILEDTLTIEYMKKYGINNVRGGCFSSYILKNEDKLVLNKIINSSENRCYGCGEIGHYIKNCKTRCTRCFRNNHTINQCFAKTDFYGYII